MTQHTRLATRIVHDAFNTYVVNHGATGIIEDDGRSRFSVDAINGRWIPTDAAARTIVTRIEQLAELVWDYQTSRRRNPAESPIRLNVDLDRTDGTWYVADYDFGREVGEVHADGTHTLTSI